jgi:hypothetical protein
LDAVPWEPAEEDSLVPSAFLKKAKLYADEDIEEELVGFLRAKGANIKSARELVTTAGRMSSTPTSPSSRSGSS